MQFISKYTWLMLYLFFTVFILFHIFWFCINAVYLQTAAGISVVVCMPQCEKLCSTINIYLFLKLNILSFLLIFHYYYIQKKSTDINN